MSKLLFQNKLFERYEYSAEKEFEKTTQSSSLFDMHHPKTCTQVLLLF